MKLYLLENIAVADEEDWLVEAVDIELRFDASDADLKLLYGIE